MYDDNNNNRGPVRVIRSTKIKTETRFRGRAYRQAIYRVRTCVRTSASTLGGLVMFCPLIYGPYNTRTVHRRNIMTAGRILLYYI